MTKPAIREAIVVEGRYDKNKLSQLIDALILVTNGFQLYHDASIRRTILQAAERTGIIIFTDSDASGFQIRSCIKSFVPQELIKHAYIPDIHGKEKRKASPGKEGKLGVEGMNSDVILHALRSSGATFLENPTGYSSFEEVYPLNSDNSSPITVADLYAVGMTGYPDSKEKRIRFLREQGLPERLGTQAAASALSRILSKEAFFASVQKFFSTPEFSGPAETAADEIQKQFLKTKE
ncbi:MAG: DUF4093 domain-containing protein [Oscillospiraceae bacterium]|nr:DUF4093 domain-containing protein [Oscillospiraceae bacterium]